MSISWSTLPLEILTLVFEFTEQDEDNISIKNVSQCALVCRGWKLATERILFYRIKLDTPEDMEIIKQFLSSKGHPTISQFVKELHYNTSNALIGNHRVIFSRLDQYFPNLQRIYTHHDIGSAVYRALLNGSFPCVNVLPLPKTSHQDKMYISCLESRKNQLEGVKLVQDSIFKRDTWSKYCDRLYQFTRLVNLQIDIRSSDTQNIVQLVEEMTLGTGLNTLKQLEFTLNAPSKLSITKELDRVQPITSLKKLAIVSNFPDRYSTCHESYMMYIMKKFPKLNYINIKSESKIYQNTFHHATAQGPYSKIPASLSKTTTRFLDYLSNLSYCNIPALITNGETVELMALLYINQFNPESIYMHHILSHSYILTPNDPGSIDPSEIVCFEQDLIGKKKKQKVHTIFQSRYASEQGHIHQYIKYLKHLGRYICDDLSVENHSLYCFADLLSQVYAHCNKLKRLHLIGSGGCSIPLNKLSPNSTFVKTSNNEGSSLTEIVFSGCKITQRTFDNNWSKAFALKYLTFDNCYFQNRFMGTNANIDLKKSSLDQLTIFTQSIGTRFIIAIESTLSYAVRYIHVQPVHQMMGDYAFHLKVEDVNESYYNARTRKNTIQTFAIKVNHLNKLIINYPKVTAYVRL